MFDYLRGHPPLEGTWATGSRPPSPSASITGQQGARGPPMTQSGGICQLVEEYFNILTSRALESRLSALSAPLAHQLP